VAGPIEEVAVGLSALAAADFQHTTELRSVWRDPPDDVPELNGAIVDLISEELFNRTSSTAGGNPLGRVVIGQAGAGKTHMLGALRRAVWRRGGRFVLLDLLDIGDFWATAALSFIDALSRPMFDRRTQGDTLLATLLPRRGWLTRLAVNIRSAKEPWQRDADALLTHLRQADPAGARTHRDVVCSFAALQSSEPQAQDYARSWLQGNNIGREGQQVLGVLAPSVAARRAVEGMSWLMSFGGPTLLAIDQIDALISVAHARGLGPDSDPARQRMRTVLNEVAGGLMALRDTLHRTMSVLSTLEATWEILTTNTVRSFAGRFHAPIRLPPLSSADLAQRLVEARLALSQVDAHFIPPYPSWPFRPDAFETAIDFSPRQLLQACEAHRTACLLRREVSELHSFAPDKVPAAVPPGVPAETVADLDGLYQSLHARAPSPDLADEEIEAATASLLRAALEALLRGIDLPPGRDLILETDSAGLHGRLRLIDNEAGGERHFCFCVITHTQARAVQPRIRGAMTASGIDRSLPFRHLFIIRNNAWPTGKVTQELVASLTSLGGRVLAFDSDDLRRFAALREMMDRRVPGLEEWLRQRRPLAGSAFVQAIGIVPALTADRATIPIFTPQTLSPTAPPSRPAITVDTAIPFGQRPGDHALVTIPLGLLPRHVAVIAGSGSGKTVFLRRLIEEAALAGVPAIVLDSNNDMVRLGMPWPEPPPEFTQADTYKAIQLAATVEIVVWTPGRSRGNPLALAPLPDFAAVRNDPDERELSVGMAAASLQGIAPMSGQAGLLRQGVLMDALRYFAAKGSGGLDALIELLRDLPPEATGIDRAAKLAAEIANALVAARARNPLLEGTGTAMNPAVLLNGADRRTRISVISLAGLPSDETRQDFVARLLMALFSHIRRNPAGPDRPVTGLLVMDEAQNFAPSSQGAASRTATVALVRQARKYGLGMVFATQMPRAIDTGIIGNCTTQLFGRLNAPAAMDTVRDILASRGGAPDDLGRLSPGQFYLTTEGRDRPQKLQAPLCLTYHAANPPSEDEVVAIAAAHPTARNHRRSDV
jgi:hypothetical protein